ncbi:MAG TPA: serine--tRNA ligase [Patescibacteria group bacterium]|jgi:seryl-tRNA synthetase|nr:serine--tRNA ligase [Patescibacteria group bacterium]
MLDIQFIRENRDLVGAKSKQKGYSVDIAKLLELDEKRRQLQKQIELLRTQRNELVNRSQGQKPSESETEQGKNIKTQIVEAENTLKPIEKDFQIALKQVPNMPLADVPVGENESGNQVAKTIGEPKKYDFKPLNHWELAEPRGMIDKERAVKISGSRFVYLKDKLVMLQFAIIQHVLQTLTNEQILKKLIEDNQLNISSKPFIPVIPPALIKTEAYEASARLNAAETTYKLEEDELWLNASAEHSLCTMYIDEIISEKELPIRYIGYSTSFRREAGSYGKDTEGLIRLHQFDKLEMEVFSSPETGLDEHKLLIAIQEYLVLSLGLPYHVLLKCTADIGMPNARGVDIETWFPGEGAYRETHTADYMTDYQARRLKTRLRRDNGKIELVHTNDATAFACGRIIAAIIENYQTSTGKIIVPDILKPYMNGINEI